ncbi:MAG: hypothetical protein O7D91_17120 [Planctomycetota bacterium]|nr:hypothetical protein [Planctomycetota bacterium]
MPQEHESSRKKSRKGEREHLSNHIMESDQANKRESAKAARRELEQRDIALPAAPATKKSQADLWNTMLDLIKKGQALEAKIRTLLGENPPRDAKDVRDPKTEESH